MGVVPIDLGTACAAVETVAQQLTTLVRSSPDLAAPIAETEWTIGESAAHLVVVLRGFTASAQGREADGMEVYDPENALTQSRLAAGNDQTLREVPHDEPEALAGLLDKGARAWLDATADSRGDEVVHTPWYGKKDIHTQSTAASMVLGELMVHGYDIARAAQVAWPIRPDHARLVLAAIPTMLPLYVDADAADGVTASYDIHVKGGPRYVVYLRNASASVQPFSSQPVDCHLSADPVALLLITYGRINQWGPITRGKLLVWGRRPWLGLKLRSLFLNP